MKTLFAIAALCLIIATTGFRCATLSPGSDPIVVRTEQTLSVAFSTMDTFLKLEDAARKLGVSPKDVHAIAEWFRASVDTPTGKTQRGIALVESADRLRVQYKLARGDPVAKEKLVTALALLESAMAEAQNAISALKHPK